MKSIKYITGDLFAALPKSKGVCIAHMVNNIGVIGGGFTNPLSQFYPLSIDVYRRAHGVKGLKLGETQFVDVKKRPQIIVANMIAQDGFPTPQKADAVDYEALEKCIRAVSYHCDPKKHQLHCPKIGAGIAGGDWAKVEPMIQNLWCDAKGFDVTIYSI